MSIHSDRKDKDYGVDYSINNTIQNSSITRADVEDKRRTLRLRKSALLKLKLDGIDRPGIKVADVIEEYKQAFNLVHNEYVGCNYIAADSDHPYHYTPYSLLPETCVFVFKSYLTVVATLTEIFDTPEYGLPMDELYREELNELRGQGRTVVELSAFVTSKHFRMRNIMVYLCNAMFQYSQINNVDDICIMVNPKHTSFYTKMFLFEPFGPERFYDKVQAPAVPLRVDMHHIEKRLHEKYSRFEYEDDLYRFFCKTNTTLDMLLSETISHKKHTTPKDVLEFFVHS